ncbi:MAG: lactate utilization protein [Endomicrobiia bacterium]
MVQDSYKTNFIQKQLENISKTLAKNNFETYVFDTSLSATEFIQDYIGENKTIGIGGSQTIVELGLIEKLQKSKNTIFMHTKNMSLDERMIVWQKAQYADFYFASPQAITLDGKLIFLDAYGNRVSSVIFGPKKVILIAGYNKIVNNLETAFWRIRNIAAVTNNLRLSRKNPCVVTGKCEDCNSQERICNVLTVLYKKPPLTDYLVILIREDLGF